MPSLAPKPTDLHRLLESVLGLYGETHPTVLLRGDFSPELPDARRRRRPAQARRAEPRRQRRRGGRDGGHDRDALERRGAGGDHDRRQRPRDRRQTSATGCSCRTSRRRPRGWGSGCPSCTRSSPTTAGASGSRTTAPRGTRFTIELPVLRGERPRGAHAGPCVWRWRSAAGPGLGARPPPWPATAS